MTRTSRGHVAFDALAPEAFEDLVQQTLEESAYIQTTWQGDRSETDSNTLIVYEVDDDE